jgi:hypothetical protein
MIAGMSPTALVLNAILAALAGFLLGNLWYRHRRALDRDRARWSSLAERRGWHLVERAGGFAVIGNTAASGSDTPSVAFHLSQGALAHGDLGVFLEARIDRSPWVILEVFAQSSPIAYTARRPGDRIRTDDAEFDARFVTYASPPRRAGPLCDPPLRAALAGLPRPYLMVQNGIVVLIWPWDKLPTDGQLDAALACLQALAAHAAPAQH